MKITKIPVVEYLIRTIRHRGPMFSWDIWNKGARNGTLVEEDLRNGDPSRIPVGCPTVLDNGQICGAKVTDWPEGGNNFKKAKLSKWPVLCDVCVNIHIRNVAQEKHAG